MQTVLRRISPTSLLAAALVVLAVVGSPSLATAGGIAASQASLDRHGVERRIKAAYLYKFASYVEWPVDAFAQADSPLVIGVAGDEPLREKLARLVLDKTIHGRDVQVRTVLPTNPGGNLHVLYAGALDSEERRALRRQLEGRPVLLVSDLMQARELRSMVLFVPVDQRLRFDVDLAPVAAGRLKVSALMLSAARRVERQP